MDNLVQFLRARLDEDEQAARAAMWDEQSDVWTARPPQARYERYIVADYCDDGVVAVAPENADPDGVGRHIARHDPARALRNVDAARKRLVELSDAIEAGRDSYDLAATLLPYELLPYADHPDYRDDWRP
ncbi:DUF6221 family protein [Streptomyces sp. NBC_01201]|uniref:DUF6221 family protein n=1 Tax=unclassified Streptomyces TaxID=2593676 RepID=UPI002E134075|nr:MULTISPECIES: DUF6221 family protein [unclassified Streptomyces]WSR09417.1 DUF6221 family protein [Streptomyces sp. NBC_01208]WSR47855.1 DUF6221 family protein [Streptomyces sp. NBC_01201]